MSEATKGLTFLGVYESYQPIGMYLQHIHDLISIRATGNVTLNNLSEILTEFFTKRGDDVGVLVAKNFCEYQIEQGNSDGVTWDSVVISADGDDEEHVIQFDYYPIP